MTIRFVCGDKAAGKQQTRYLHRALLFSAFNDFTLIGIFRCNALGLDGIFVLYCTCYFPVCDLS